LNEVGDEHQLPFEFVEGNIDKISLSVPWMTMFKESSIIHVDGLSLTLRPNAKETEGKLLLSFYFLKLLGTFYNYNSNTFRNT